MITFCTKNNDLSFEQIIFHFNSLQQFQVVFMCHTVNFEFTRYIINFIFTPT